MVRVKSPQDFWAGILFALAGCAALWVGRNYAFGTLTRTCRRNKPSPLLRAGA
jgi:hypothetical protein